MKKHKILITLVILALVCFGAVTGWNIANYFAPKAVTTEKIDTRKVALVNLDTGVTTKDGDKVYYSKQLVDANENFEYTGLQNAQTGLKNGTFGGYIIIPEDFSESIASVNGKPTTAKLKYKLNGNLKVKTKDLVLSDLISFKDDIMYKVSYLYLTDILGEMQDGQSKTAQVLANDNKSLVALSNVDGNDFVSTVNIPTKTPIDGEGANVDIEPELNSNLQAAKKVEDTYTPLQISGDKLANDAFTDLTAEQTKISDGSEDSLITKVNTFETKLKSETVNQTYDGLKTSFQAIKSKAGSGNDAGVYYLTEAQYQTLVSNGYNSSVLNQQKVAFDTTNEVQLYDNYIANGSTIPGNENQYKQEAAAASHADTEKQAIIDNIYNHLETIKTNVTTNKQGFDACLAALKQSVTDLKTTVKTNNDSINKKVGNQVDANKTITSSAISTSNQYVNEVIAQANANNQETVKKANDKINSLKGTINANITNNNNLLQEFTNKLPNAKIGNNQNTTFKEHVVKPIDTDGILNSTKINTTTKDNKLLILLNILTGILAIGLQIALRRKLAKDQGQQTDEKN